MASASVPRRGRSGAASTAPAAGKKSTTGALVARTESLASNGFCALSCRLSKRRAVHSASFSSAAGYLKSVLSLPEPLQHMPDKADHGFRTAFMKDGCGGRSQCQYDNLSSMVVASGLTPVGIKVCPAQAVGAGAAFGRCSLGGKAPAAFALIAYRASLTVS